MQKKKGISLIVLVITIIVMIILAAAVVVSLNNTGIINKANQAVNLANEKQVQELATLIWSDYYMDDERGDKLKESVIEELKNNGVTETDWNIDVSDTGINVSKKDVAKILKAPVVRTQDWASGAINAQPSDENISGQVLYIGATDDRTEYYEIYINDELKKTISVSGTELFFIESDGEELFPEIKYNEDSIEVIGHYSDMAKCAKMTMLAELYAYEYRSGYAKFPNTLKIKETIININNTVEQSNNYEESKYLFASNWGLTISVPGSIRISNVGLAFKPTGSPEVAVRVKIASSDGWVDEVFETTSIDFEPSSNIEGVFKFKNIQNVTNGDLSTENITEITDTNIKCISVNLSEYNLTGEENIYVIAKAEGYNDSEKSIAKDVWDDDSTDGLYFSDLYSADELNPEIRYNEDNIEVIGHYSDVTRCAKMSLLAELYAEEYEEGYAKFPNTKDVKMALKKMSNSIYFKYVTKVEFDINGHTVVFSCTQID